MSLPTTGAASRPAMGERVAESRRRHAEALEMGDPPAVDRHRASGRCRYASGRTVGLIGIDATVLAGTTAPVSMRKQGAASSSRRSGSATRWCCGIHACLGAQLARIEARVALPKILDRLGGIRVLGDVAWRPNIASRAVTGLRVGHG